MNFCYSPFYVHTVTRKHNSYMFIFFELFFLNFCFSFVIVENILMNLWVMLSSIRWSKRCWLLLFGRQNLYFPTMCRCNSYFSRCNARACVLVRRNKEKQKSCTFARSTKNQCVQFSLFCVLPLPGIRFGNISDIRTTRRSIFFSVGW